jgi:hypothetical protein
VDAVVRSLGLAGPDRIVLFGDRRVLAADGHMTAVGEAA